MSTLQTAETIRERLGANGSNAKCPAHDDKHGSLSISNGENGKVLLKCHAGCTQAAVIDALRTRGIWPEAEPKGLTVADLAAAKHLPVELLHDSGFSDDEIKGQPVVRMTCRDAAGKILCVRYRGALGTNGSGPKFWFRKGDKQQLFGLWRLRPAEPVILVEGETDSIALWDAGFNALGVPGAEAWHDSRFANYLARNSSIFVHIEPDAGGEKFRAKFERSSLRDKIRFFTVAPAAKDPCELRSHDIHGFRAAIEAAMSRSETKKLNGADKPLNPIAPPRIVLRSALELAQTIVKVWWLLEPYLERNASILLFGDLGTLKSFLALHWALTCAIAGHCVVYLSAEGKGLPQRIKGSARHRWGDDWQRELAKLPFFGIERPLNLSSAIVVAELVETMEHGGVEPALVVVDTISKNSDGTIERSNEDAQVWLNQVDQELRSRFGATVLLVHHCGHEAKGRARGPYSLMANTDANFLIERPDVEKLLITVKAGRMKDTESPAPFSLQAKVVETGDVDDQGKGITTLVLEPTDTVVTAKASRPTGRAQKSILSALERRKREGQGLSVWTIDEVREIAKGLEIAKSSSRDAIRALIESGFLKQTVGGLELAYQP